jgi:hypothetical protein
MNYKLPAENARTVFEALAQAHKNMQGDPQTQAHICRAVATIIAGAGRFGGTEQTNLMHEADAAGFNTYFYGGFTIRVN